MARHVIVHCHIYKNAGSSIDRLLWDSFGDGFVILDPLPGHQTLDWRAVRHYLAENPHIKAISSHRLHPPFVAPADLPIVLLRHPVDRAKSAYSFARLNPAMPDHIIARDASFAEYVGRSLGTRGEGAILRNYQVHHLSSAAYRADDPVNWKSTEVDLLEAKNLISSLPAFGLVRRFTDSCRLFNTSYKPRLPAVWFHDWAENVSRSTSMTEDEAIAEIRAEIGGNAFEALMAANSLDLQLYAFAQSLFDQRLRSLATLSSKLAAGIKLMAGRVRQRITEPELYGKAVGEGSARHPERPAYERLPPWDGTEQSS